MKNVPRGVTGEELDGEMGDGDGLAAVEISGGRRP
jgi:hypothetical protein